MPQLVQPLHGVYFELTLAVARTGITSPIISIANSKTVIVLRTGNAMNKIQISVCSAPYSKGMTYRWYNVPQYRTYLNSGSEVANVI